jgi:hypothetical protein
MGKKSSCPITRAQFRQNAKPLTIKIGDKEFKAVVKEFSTGSLGWNVNDKMTVDLGGTDVTVQIGMNLTIIGSKDLPPDSGSGMTTPQEGGAPAS